MSSLHLESFSQDPAFLAFLAHNLKEWNSLRQQTQIRSESSRSLSPNPAGLEYEQSSSRDLDTIDPALQVFEDPTEAWTEAEVGYDDRLTEAQDVNFEYTQADDTGVDDADSDIAEPAQEARTLSGLQAAQKERPGLIAADKSHAQLLADPLKPIPKPVGVKKYTSTGRAYDSPLHKKEVKQTLGLDDNDWKGISACAREQVRAFQLDAKDSKNKTIPWPDKLAANKKGAMDTLKTAWPILKRAVDRWAAKFFLTSQANNRKDESEEPEGPVTKKTKGNMQSAKKTLPAAPRMLPPQAKVNKTTSPSQVSSKTVSAQSSAQSSNAQLPTPKATPSKPSAVQPAKRLGTTGKRVAATDNANQSTKMGSEQQEVTTSTKGRKRTATAKVSTTQAQEAANAKRRKATADRKKAKDDAALAASLLQEQDSQRVLAKYASPPVHNAHGDTPSVSSPTVAIPVPILPQVNPAPGVP